MVDAPAGCDLDVVSHNVNRASFDNVVEIIEDLEAVKRGLYCLQEVSSWP